MTYSEALLYGAIQGITEYLPISSSAHLILLPKFLHTEDPGLTFDVFLHLGTLLATLAYFWRDWRGILASVPGVGKWVHPSGGDPRSHSPRWPDTVSWKLIVIATIPALVVGGLFHKKVETVLRGNIILAVGLSIGGILLYLCDRFAPRNRTLTEMTAKDALLVGIAQCFALSPGMSRSGSTMIGGRLLKLDRASSARFSFLISAPVTAAAIVFELRHWHELLNSTLGAGQLLAAGLSSFVFGCVAIGGLMTMLKRFGYLSFAIYRVALAVVIINVLGV